MRDIISIIKITNNDCLRKCLKNNDFNYNLRTNDLQNFNTNIIISINKLVKTNN
jgi:hypothetical protein